MDHGRRSRWRIRSCLYCGSRAFCLFTDSNTFIDTYCNADSSANSDPDGDANDSTSRFVNQRTDANSCQPVNQLCNHIPYAHADAGRHQYGDHGIAQLP